MAINKATLSKKVNGNLEYIYPKSSADMIVYNNTTVKDKLDELNNAASSTSTNISGLETSIQSVETKIDDHIADSDNPHSVTYSQVGAAAASHTHNASDINSGTLGVARGGTGKSSVTAGNYLVGNGTSALSEKTPAQVLSDIGAAAASHGTHVTYSTTNPVMDGSATPGTATTVARSDHKHPTDTTRAPLDSPAFTGTPTAPTAAAGTNTTQVATTSFVKTAVEAAASTASSNLISHLNDKDNPHEVTTEQIGAVPTTTKINGYALSEDIDLTYSDVNAAKVENSSYYGTCATAAGTAEKAVTCADFTLVSGATIRVKFSNDNTAANPTLNVNFTGAKPIKGYGTIAPTISNWPAGSVIEFTYDGTNWLMHEGWTASTTYYGVTKLSDAINSTSTVLAATANAAKKAYDRGSTGITNAATAQSTIDTHKADKNNPHEVTTEQIGAVPTTTTVNGHALSSNITLTPEDIGGSKVENSSYYGTCSTEAATAAKVVVCNDFTLASGATIRVKFSNTNTAASPTLNVNSTGAKNITAHGTTAITTYQWQAGAVVEFTYDGTSWIMHNADYATTTYYGVTKLSDAINSTSTTLAATANAAKKAYDRGSTGITNAATAQSTIDTHKADKNNPHEVTTAQIGAVPTTTTINGHDLSSNVTLTPEDIGGSKVENSSYYGTCETAQATAEKAVVCADFELIAGSTIRVKFTYTNTATNPKLNVNSTGAKNIVSHGTTAITTYQWQAGAVVEFTYDGTSWIMHNADYATTSYYGVTKLANSVTSTSNSLAATANAAKTAYDAGVAAQTAIDTHKADKNNPHEVTADQVGAVPTTRTVNGKALSSDITLAYGDVGAAAASHGTHVTYSTTNPVMDGSATPGTATTVARSDHKHPTDTTRAPLVSPALTGTPTAPTAAEGTDTTQIATTSFVQTAVANASSDLNDAVDSLTENLETHEKLNNHVYYGTCSTAAGTAAKVVTCAEFTEDKLVTGVGIRVKFTNATSVAPTTMNVNSTGAKNVYAYGTTAAQAYQWYAGEVVEFTYDGTGWVITEAGIATTTYYGRTKLSSSTSSTSTSLAATASAVKAAYDRGSTGITNAATAQSTIDTHIADKNNPHEVTVSQIGAVPDTRTINSKPLSSDITLTYSDVGALKSDANAVSATKLKDGNTIDGVLFTGGTAINHYGICGTAAGTAAKVVDCTGFSLVTGSEITVKFSNTNTAASPTLNVNSTGAKAIQYRGSAITAGYLAANRTYRFVYDGSAYQLIGDIDTNTTYTAATANPLMDGTAAVGTSAKYAREDHVHPTDTTRAPLASPNLTGTPTAPTAAAGTNTTQIATTAYVTTAVANAFSDLNDAVEDVQTNLETHEKLNNHVYYGTCATAAGTAAKVVDCTEFTSDKLVTGVGIRVKFTNATSVAPTTININSTGAKNVYAYGTTAAPAYIWNAGEVVEFTYDGTSWVMSNAMTATTTYYGVTKLSDAINSTSTVLAATANAAKKAYDRGSTGITNAATAQSTIDTHIADKNNPHEVTVSQIGAVPTTTTINGKALSSNITLTAADVGAVATETQLSKGTTSGSGNAVTDITVSNHKITLTKGTTFATKDELDAVAATATNAMTFKGTLGTSGTITALPDSPVAGDTYKVITAGTYGSLTGVKVGDTIVYNADLGWVLIPSGDEPSGTVTSVKIAAGSGIAVSSTSAITTSGTRTISHADTSSQESVTSASRTYINSVTLDDFGHVTALGTGSETVTDTHHTSGTIISNSATGTTASTSALTNGNVYLNHIENGAVRNSHKISGAGGATVASDTSGNITITSATYTAATATPLVAGTAAVGTSTKYAREDHVHPLQTTVSGNAGTATTLATGRAIDGVTFNGSAAITHYGTCSTAAGTAAKVVDCTSYTLVTGSEITVKFTTTNTAASPTLNVNSTGAKAIQYRGAAITAGYLAANRTYRFVYDGSAYQLIGDIDTNTTYTAATATPLVAGTAAVGTSTKYAREDHVHPVQTSVSGNAGTATKFASAQSVALTGDVTGSASSQAGWSVATTLANSGVTAGSYGPSDNATPNLGDTFNVPYLTIDVKGRETAASTKTVTLPKERFGAVDSTSAAAAYTVTVNNFDSLYEGCVIYVLNNKVANNASATIAVNGGDAKPIYYQNAAITKGLWPLGTVAILIYNTTAVSTGCWNMVYSYGANSTYSNQSLGNGYGTCTTAADTAAKVVALSSYTLAVNGHVSVYFQYDVPADATLNINSKGAKPIYYNNAAITAGVIKAGMIATFVYNGTNYYLVAVDRVTITTSGSGNAIIDVSVVGNNVTVTKGSVGTVTKVTAGTGLTGGDITGTGTIALDTSGVTAGSAGPTAAVTGSNGTTVAIPRITVDTYGRVTALTSYNLTNKDTNTTYSAGVGMTLSSTTFKTKLKSETALANDSTAATETSGRIYPVVPDKSGYLAVNVPWTDTTYSGNNGITLDGTTFGLTSGVVTAGTAGPTAAVTGSNGTTIAVPRITVDTYGRVTALTSYNLTNKDTTYTAATATPLVAGTAAVGTSTKYAREDHVHPVQTSVSGNAGTATTLATGRAIDGVTFNGSAAITHYGTCSTAAATAAKTVDCSNFTLVTGSEITVKFTTTNTAASPTLNVNSTGAKAIQYRGAAITAGYLAANRTYRFVYDGSAYQLIGDIDTDNNTTYSAGTGLSLSSNKFSLASGVVTAGSAGPTAAVSGTNGTTVAIPRITVDTYGRVTGLTSYNLTNKDTTYSAATTSANGLMSSTDKYKVDNITGIYAVKGTQTATTGSWTGVINAPALYDGMTIAYYLPYAGSGNATLNLTLSGGGTTGAVNCYWNNNSRMTTHYGAGSTILMTYWSAGSISVAGTATTDNRWTHCDYDSNSNTIPTAYCSTAAGTAAKAASCTNYVLTAKTYIQVLFTVANSSSTALTLNINSTGAKPIYINGSASSTSNYTLPAGSYFAYYDGTNYYLRTDGVLTASITGSAASATTATKFASAQSVALTGDVTGSASSQAGWSVATTLANSGVTAGSYGPSDNATPSAGSTFNVPYITVDAKGRVTAASTKTVTIPAAPTSVSGNAGTATTLATGRAIDGVTFNGSAAITHYGTCSTAAGTAAKVVACTSYTLVTGSEITVKFTKTNTAASPTLNVNSTGAKAIQYRGAAITAGYLAANRTYRFVYDGSAYQLIGDIDTDTNTTYSAGTGLSLSGTAFSLASGVVTAGSAGPTAAVTGSNNTTVAIPRITVDTYGRVTALTSYNYTSVDHTYTIPSASSTTPSALGTAAVGSATTYARADHVHPTNVTKGTATCPAASSWSGPTNNLYYTTVSISGFTASTVAHITPTISTSDTDTGDAQQTAWDTHYYSETVAGGIKFYAKSAPTTAVSFSWEVVA